ncbi:MAG: protein BatD, partial [Bacteroidales bacterium]|nr:protein BatD [Bacteroidales bacterium]
KTAGVLLKQNSYAKFYEEVHRALWGYIGDKLGVPPSDHDKEYVCTLLTERNAPQPLIAELSDLIETCEFARYAPAPEVGEMDTVYGRALQIITNIEQTIK